MQRTCNTHARHMQDTATDSKEADDMHDKTDARQMQGEKQTTPVSTLPHPMLLIVPCMCVGEREYVCVGERKIAFEARET